VSNKRLNATITIGGAIAASLRNALGSAKDGLNEVGSAIRKVEREQRTLGSAIQTFARMGKNVDGLRERYAAATVAVDRLRAANQRLAAVENARQANLAKRGELRGQMFDAVAIGAAVAVPIVQAAKFETAMLGVAKQVEGARDKGGKLTQVYADMAKQIQMLGHELPIATNEIADMVTAAARMNIPTKYLLDFTRTAAMMATAFEMPAAQLTDNMGKIAGIFKIPMKNIAELGDAINFLDDNAISKGSDIIKVMQGDLAGAASTMGLSAKNAAALASTFLTLGESAERADTAASGMLRQLQIAKMNPKKFQVGVGMLGMTSDQLQKGMVTDPQKMILDVLERIKKLPVEKQMEAVTRLFGKDWGGAIAKLAGGVDEYRRQLELANGEAGKDSMSREFQARMQTTAAQWELLKNRVTELSVNIGTVLLPTVQSFFGVLGPVVSGMAGWSREHPVLTKAVIGTTVALVALRLATLASGYAFTFVKGAALQFAGVLAGVQARTALAAASTRAMGAASVVAQGGLMGMASRALPAVLVGIRAIGAALMTTPIGLAVTGIATAGALVWKYWEPLKSFFSGFGEGVVAGLAPIGQAISAAFAPVAAVVGPVVMPILETVGGWFRAAVGWVGSLLAPIDKASSTTKAFGEAGKVVGQAVAGAFTFMLGPIGLVVNAITFIRDNIGTVLEKARSLGGAAVNWLTGGGSAAPAGLPAPAPLTHTAASAPPMASSRTGSQAAPSVTQANTFHITQQPGQSSRQLADEIARRIAEQNGVRRRGAMFDGVTP